MNTLSKAGILDAVTKLGKDLAWYANPMNHPCRYGHHRHEKYQEQLERCRKAYFNINNDLQDPQTELTQLKRVCFTGAESNLLNLILSGIKGELNPKEGWGWIVSDEGFLVFKEPETK